MSAFLRFRLLTVLAAMIAAVTLPSIAQATTALDTPAAKATNTEDPDNVNYIYEKPTRQKLSRLYWALGMMDSKNDVLIDNYLKINECDIYKDYYFNEFEWKNVRESTRLFLEENKQTFPLRFEVVQPLYLSEYDFGKKVFHVLPKYQIKETTRFQIFPLDIDEEICLPDGLNGIPVAEGYPVGIVAEFNRPLDFTKIPVEPAVARRFIDEKLLNFKQLASKYQTKENVYNMRDAYLFMQIKFFAAKRSYFNSEALPVVDVMAVVESFQIYADRKKQMLLWSQDYRRKKPRDEKKLSDSLNLDEDELDEALTPVGAPTESDAIAP